MIRLLFILFICSTNAIGQTSSGKEYIIDYSVGHYNFGKTGEYEKKEIFKFTINDEDFVLTEFQSISNKYVYNPETLKNDRKVSDTILKFPNNKIAKEEFENLLKQLNQHEDNFNADFLSSKFSTRISEKEILKIAKKNEVKFLFIDDETGKIDDSGKEKIKEIQSLKNFEKYIEDVKPKTDTFMAFSDAWNFARLGYANSTLTDRMDFNSILGQPILKSDNITQIINLNVNLILLKILPKESLLIKEVNFENIKDGYINWFIRNIN
ncbi:hypothetical protein CLU81_0379 [Flavobacterium sp. 9]|uniref:hypothetical protein n=1 Tax=Flavobacterium sp. 9 TaxID=2035198 RepID=UPI000C181E5F|nr:hypothetical protein [Flavobacterium sp. 9]PIF29993.1 hypothetical protein CLU81_0379 [Flavobacterium sp. 9]